ncbi:MAG: DUF523 domain-containing protein [Bacilli bacterium]|nr:DUF523 domain-containing protein [Bacilli bacterium]
MEKYIVSSCLAGINCRYDGSNVNNELINKLVREGIAIPLCPEQLGGLPTPREPVECTMVEGKMRVLSKNGKDYTEYFERGANIVLEFAKKYDIKKVIFQKNSPSCGCRAYDGTFSHTLADYSGITAKMLMDNGLEVISIEDLEERDFEKILGGQ